MRYLLQILAKYSNFLVFILLEVVAFLLLLTHNPYPRSRFLNTTNSWVSWQVGKVQEVKNYFRLRTVNEKLAEENALLRDSLTRMALWQEKAKEQGLDCSETPYEYSHLQLHYIPARVIHMSRSLGRPYLTINKGERDSVAIGMGVRSKEGAVGIVSYVSEHYALVMPLIHRQARLSCRLSSNQYVGSLVWSGCDRRSAELQDIATHIAVEQGDKIETSGLTTSFPAGIPVGEVRMAEVKEGEAYYRIQVALATDFEKLDYVQVIRNDWAQEQNGLNERME